MEAPLSPASTRAPWGPLALLALALGIQAPPRAQLALLAALALVQGVQALPAPAMPQQHDFKHVRTVSLEERTSNPGRSQNGHYTPYAHDLKLVIGIEELELELELELMHHLFAKDLVLEEQHEPSLVSYSAKGVGIRGSVTVHDLGTNTFFAVLRTSEDIYTFLTEERSGFELGSPTGMVMYKDSDLGGHDHRELLALTGEFELPGPGRQLLADISQPFKSDCLPGGKTWALSVGLVADDGYIAAAGGNTKLMTNLQEIVAVTSDIYSTQFKTHLTISAKTYFGTAGAAWNLQPQGTSQKCNVASASADLTLLKTWASASDKVNKVGVYHLFTNCFPPPGTVGIAWKDVPCIGQGYNTGLTTYMASRTWLTFAHEIGHNIGADHSFENGQGSTGGIMDYGDGKTLDGKYQFNRNLRQNQMCTTLTEAANKGQDWCMKEYANTPTPAPRPTSQPTSRSCPGVNKYRACAMWKKLGDCDEEGPVATWMCSNCGAACSAQGMVVDPVNPNTQPATEVPGIELVCGDVLEKIGDRCCAKTPGPPGQGGEALQVDLVVGTGGATGVLLTGRLQLVGAEEQSFEVGLEAGVAYLLVGDYEVRHHQSAAAGAVVSVNDANGDWVLSVDGDALPALPWTGDGSLKNARLLEPAAGPLAASFTVFGVDCQEA